MIGALNKTLQGNAQKYVPPNMFTNLGRKLLGALANAFGMDDAAAMLSKKGAAFGAQFGYFMESIKIRAIDSISGFGATIRDFADRELVRLESLESSASKKGKMNPIKYIFGDNLYKAMMKDISESLGHGGGIESTLSAMRAESARRMEEYASLIESQSEAYKEAMKRLDDMGLSRDQNAQIVQLKEQFKDGIMLTDDLETLTQSLRGVQHSRVPVYRESLDEIVGVLHVRDLLPHLGPQSKPGGNSGFRTPRGRHG